MSLASFLDEFWSIFLNIMGYIFPLFWNVGNISSDGKYYTF